MFTRTCWPSPARVTSTTRNWKRMSTGCCSAVAVCVKSRTRRESRSRPDSLLKVSRIPCMSAQSYSLYVCSVVFLVCLLSRIPCMSAQSYSLYVCSVVFLVCLLSVCRVQNEEREQIKARFAPKGQSYSLYVCSVCVKSRTRSESRSKPDSLLKVSRIPCMSAQCVQNEEREQIKARFAPKGQSYSLYVCSVCVKSRTRSESRSRPDSLLKVSRIPCMSAQCV